VCFDGTGYPDGMGGHSLDVGVRIVSVMNTFDRLTGACDARRRLSFETARDVIARGSGRQFCPWIVSGFLALPAATLRHATQASPSRAVLAESPAGLSPELLATPWEVDTTAHPLCAC
jgi:response regulator RpfG family c-di-GMP phosphodiesterase